MAAQKELTTYIALFHDRDNAASAIRDLEQSGFTRNALTVIGERNGSTSNDAADTFGDGYGRGDQTSLDEIGVPNEDRNHLQDVLRDGGVVLALEGAGDRADEIENIFSRHSTKTIDEKHIGDGSSFAPYAAAGIPATDLDQTLIPVTREDLVVGKREVDRGGVRVFRRMVEEPVTEAVNLREEHVVVDRRVVDRPVTEADLLGGGQVIELVETAEEVVVGKTSRVVEEIRVGKSSTEHTETIRDTVRHTEVDVEQLGSVDPANPTTKY